MRAGIVDPSAFTPPYDHALAAALARERVEVELLTSSFAYGPVAEPQGYLRRELFYRHARGPAGSGRRSVTKALEHVPDMARLRRLGSTLDVLHFQWLDLPWIDRWLLPRTVPTVLTAHDLLPREPRPGQVAAQRRLLDRVDAVVVHSDYGRRELLDRGLVDPDKLRVIHHGAFDHLTRQPDERPLPGELAAVRAPVVLFFGLLRPYKGLETLLEAWSAVSGAELWIVGRPRMALEPLQARANDSVRFVPRYISEPEIAAYFRRADVVVLPYARTERFDQSGVLATALAFGKPVVASAIGGFTELGQIGAARIVPPGDPARLRGALASLLAAPGERLALGEAAARAAAGPYSWSSAASATAALYRELITRHRSRSGRSSRDRRRTP